MKYLDNAATTSIGSKPLEVLLKESQKLPTDNEGLTNETILDAERFVKSVVGGSERDQVVFTSGSTEALNLLLIGYYLKNHGKSTLIVTSPIEHKAVLEPLKYLESIGATIKFLKLTEDGAIDTDHLQALVKERPLFVTLMHVNNETGELLDLEKVYSICQGSSVPFFTDTTQSIGKIDLSKCAFDACVGSAHKFHGPRGVGFLFCKEYVELQPLFFGGIHHSVMRPGTPDLPAIQSMIVAIMDAQIRSRKKLYRPIISQILTQHGYEFKILGGRTVAYINAYMLPTVDFTQKSLIRSILKDVVVGFGSACNQGVDEPSHVYKELCGDRMVIRESFGLY